MSKARSYIKEHQLTNTIARKAALFLCCLLSLNGFSQTGEKTVEALVKMGFENVGWSENAKERVYVMENIAYRLNSIGIGKAVDVVQKIGLPDSKSCRLIFLDNNIPMISLCYQPVTGDSLTECNREDWKVSYDLGNNWREATKGKKNNRSLFKVDIVIYPDLSFQNYRLSKIYESLWELSPTIEVSLWKGMKFNGQITIPIVNDGYSAINDYVHPGYITLSQTIRLPHQIFLTGRAGFFSNYRWGFDVKGKHYFKDERFSVEARIGYTGRGYFDKFSFYHGKKWTLNGQLGGNFYWSKYNTQFSLKAERYLNEEYGARIDMIRHFRYASIGFYGMKVQYAGNKGFNGGFQFRIALPPYKYKRRGYIPRVLPSETFGLSYNAGNERYYGKGFNTEPDDNYLKENSFNPYFIKSELLNY
ncbi:MAG: hypothetical protein RR365_07650 [Bacteroides sp.]